MSTETLLKKLNNPNWDYSKPFEILKIGKYESYRYIDSILVSPRCHFHIATKYSSRGKGYAEELIKRVFKITEYMMTTISSNNEKGIKRLLERIGFEWDDYYKTWNLEKK